jgi:O-Antigen ligase
MKKLLEQIDESANIETTHFGAKLLERTAFICLILMTLFAPHSIALTQTFWLTGMLAWAIRLVIKPRPKLVKSSKLDIALWAFFGWTVISSVFSYAPDISIDKLRGAALFLIFYFVINNLRTMKAVKFIVAALITSCMVSVLWTPIERIFGRGVEIHGLSATGCLSKAILLEGDTILKANNKKVSSPEAFVAELERNEVSKVEFYRPDFNAIVEVKRSDLLSGDALGKLGIESWKHSRNWRSTGFYSQYVTFAEVLQLIASLAFGLFIASFQIPKLKFRIPNFNSAIRNPQFALFLCLAFMSLALLMTSTRASQLAFIISAFAIVIFNGNRKLLLGLAVVVLPVALIGLYVLQQSRNVGFFDSTDNSITWRETVWREGFKLATDSPRHLVVGVGMDSIKRFKEDWHLFDDGKLPVGHFHSTPLQLAVERGIPALLLWLLILGIYWKQLGSAIRRCESKIEKGILLGCLGGSIGFFASSCVHYNLGDAEVAMVFFLLMGVSSKIILMQTQNNSVN